MTASAPSSAPGHLTAAPVQNGLGIAALCCGVAGILAGLVPILFVATAALGLLAIVFGIFAIHHVSTGKSSNRVISIGGLVTGVIAFGLAVWGVSVIFAGLAALSHDLDELDSAGASPAAQIAHVVTHQEAFLLHQSLFIGNW